MQGSASKRQALWDGKRYSVRKGFRGAQAVKEGNDFCPSKKACNSGGTRKEYRWECNQAAVFTATSRETIYTYETQGRPQDCGSKQELDALTLKKALD